MAEMNPAQATGMQANKIAQPWFTVGWRTVPDRRRGHGPFQNLGDQTLLRGQELDPPLEAGLGDDPPGLEARLALGLSEQGPGQLFGLTLRLLPDVFGLSKAFSSRQVRLGPGVVQDLVDDLFQAHRSIYGSLMPFKSRTVARRPRTAYVSTSAPMTSGFTASFGCLATI